MGAELFAAAIVAFALTYLIHSTLLLLGAQLLTNALPSRFVRLRERIWRVAFLGGFATAGLQLGLGLETPRLSWVLRADPVVAQAPLDAPPARAPRRETPAPHAHTPAQGAAPQLELPLAWSTAVPAEAPLVAAVWSEPTESTGPTGPTGPAATGSGRLEPIGTLPDSRPAWATWAALVWAGTGLVVLAFLAVLVVRLRRSLAGRRELDSGSLPVLLEGLCRRAGTRAHVRLYLAPRLTAPISVGWLRPAICVPPRAVTDLGPQEQEALLAHELAHLVRRDPVWFFLCWLIESLFFFQPLNRLARRRLQDAAEILCDDWAVRHTGRDLSLASCLARVAEWIVKRPRPLLAAHLTHGLPATASHARSRLGRRIERLLDDRKTQEPPGRWMLPVATAALASLTWIGPGVAAVGALDLAVEPQVSSGPQPAPPLAPAPAPAPAPRPEPREVLAIQPGELARATRPGSPAPPELPQEALITLDEEVALLGEELCALRADLDQLDLDSRFDEALRELEDATRGLDEHRRRLEFLVQRAQARGLRP